MYWRQWTDIGGTIFKLELKLIEAAPGYFVYAFLFFLSFEVLGSALEEFPVLFCVSFFSHDQKVLQSSCGINYFGSFLLSARTKIYLFIFKILCCGGLSSLNISLV